MGEQANEAHFFDVPKWARRLIYRLAQLERGKAYDVTVVMPSGEGDPVWVVRGVNPVENAKN